MTPRILLFLVTTIFINSANAQFNRPNPSDNACTAPYFCNTAQLNAHNGTIRTPIIGKSYLVPKGFCGSLESPSWYKFKANTASLSLRFSATGGCGADGVQAVIFSTTNCGDSASFIPVSNCINANGGKPIDDVSATNLIAGETYYLLVDGYSGAGCSFKINVLSGTIQDVVDPLPTPTVVFGAQTLCTGTTSVTYSVPANTNATEYIFSFQNNSGTAQIFSSPDSFYNYTNLPANGTVKVCVNYKNDCTQSAPTCTNVVFGVSNTVTLPTIYLCPGASATLGDGSVVTNSPTPATDATSKSTYTKTGTSGCDTTFNVDVVKYASRRVSKFFFIKPGKSETLGSVILKPNTDCSPNSGQSVLKSTALNGCDSIVNYTVYNAAQSFTLAADKLTLACAGSDSVSLSLQNNNDACATISHNLKYKWLYKANFSDPFTDLNNNTINQKAKTAGNYFIVITDSVFVKIQPLFGNRVFSDTLFIQISKNNTGGALTQPSAINGKNQVYLCQASTTTFTIPAVVGAKSYSWRTPNGVIKTGQGTTSVDVFWQQNAATDTLEVIAVGDCNVSAPRTLTIYFINFANLYAGNDSSFCDTTAQMNATTSTIAVGGVGIWSNAASNANAVTFINKTLPNSKINVSTPGIYDLIWTENYSNCTKSDTVRFTISKQPTVSNVTDSCSADNKTSFLKFTITDGTAPYTLTNATTNVKITINNSGNATSLGFVKGTYNFSLTDKNNCSAALITGTSSCVSCVGIAGAMNTKKLVLCYGDTARGIYLGGLKKNIGDTAEFVLHNGDPRFGILKRSTAAKFSFFPGLTYGNTYYISEVVGKDSSGHVTVLDNCFNAGIGEPVVFNDKPRVLFTSTDSALCKGNCAKIQFLNIGNAPFTIRTRITDTIKHDSSFLNVKNNDVLTFCPQNSTALRLLSVVDSLGCSDSTLMAQLNFAVYPPPSAGTSLPALKICASLDTTISLFTRLNNADVGGVWSEISAVKSSGAAFNAKNGTFKVLNQKGSVYQFAYIKTAQPNASTCKADTAFVSIELITAPVADAGLDDTLSCAKRIVKLGGNNSTQGNNTTVSWSGNGLSGNVLTQYVTNPGTYVLTIKNAGCVATDTVNVFIDTVSPTAKIKPVVGLISCVNPKITLDASPSTPKIGVNYIWLLDNTPINQTVSFAAVNGGSYTLKVVLQKNGCYTIDTVSLVEDKTKPTVLITPPSSITCADSVVTLDASRSSNGNNFTFKWSTRLGGKFKSDATTLFPKVNSGGDFQLVITNTTNNCSDSATVTVSTDTVLPLAKAYATDSLNCRNKTVSLSAKGTTFGKSINYLWLARPGNIISGETTLNATVDQPGMYIFIVNNTNNGCTTTDSVSVKRIKAFPQSQRILTAQPSCYGECDATVRVDTIIGGTPPYRFSLDGLNYFTSQNFNNLCAGKYRIYTQDVNGCQIDTSLLLPQPQQLLATIGIDTLINLGDSLTLQLYVNSDSLLSTQWSFYADSACQKAKICLQQTVKPTSVTTYTVHVTDKNLCSTDAQIIVSINKDKPVFIPTVFSPNGDGQNDIFYIFSASVVRKVRSFNIFNRWGENVFSQSNFSTNNPLFGWDGFFNGKESPLGVYTYSAEIEFLDNSVVLYTGEVMLMR